MTERTATSVPPEGGGVPLEFLQALAAAPGRGTENWIAPAALGSEN